MRIAFVSTASHFDVRFTKIAATAHKAGHELFFVGLDRQPEGNLPSPPAGVTVKLLKRSVPNRRAVLRALPAFLRHVLRSLREIKPDVVYCRDEEAVMFALTARLAGCGTAPIICDLYDSLPLRVPGKIPRLIARAAAALALAVSRQIIVTDDNRRGLLPRRLLSRVTVLPNYPRRADVIATNTLPTGPTRILIAGQLLPMRGLPQILAACEGLTDIELVCAGQVFVPWVRDVFLQSPLTRYLGVLPQPRVLQLTEACDAVFSFYEPLTPNDVHASPNKLFDAMAVGRPVIINAETTVAQFVRRYALGYVTPFYDTEGLRTVLRTLREARPTLASFSRRVTALSHREYCWEAVDARLNAVLSPGALQLRTSGVFSRAVSDRVSTHT